jgi:hypothetical protein
MLELSGVFAGAGDQFRNTCRQDADLLSLRAKGEKGCAAHPSPVGDSAVTVSSRILPGQPF